MTDDELIEGLRKNALWVTTHDAADRIEQLVKERDAATIWATEQHACADSYALLLGQEKAKLAKAGIVALETILNERGPVFDAMVDAAEDAALKDVSFNVVVWRSILAGLDEMEKTE